MFNLIHTVKSTSIHTYKKPFQELVLGSLRQHLLPVCASEQGEVIGLTSVYIQVTQRSPGYAVSASLTNPLPVIHHFATPTTSFFGYRLADRIINLHVSSIFMCDILPMLFAGCFISSKCLREVENLHHRQQNRGFGGLKPPNLAPMALS